MAKPNVVTKDDLLRSAERCVATQGIQALTLKAVAEGANVTQGTVYYHFRNKEQLLLELVQKTCRNAWSDLPDSAESPEKFVREALRSAEGRCSADSLFHRVFFSLVATGIHQERVRLELGKILQEENDSLQSLLHGMLRTDSFHGLPTSRWALLLNALIDGLALHALVTPDFDAKQAYADLGKLIGGLFEDCSETGGNVK